jgi:hypothetical protein
MEFPKNNSDGCTVIEKKSRDVKPCIFPFKYSGQTLSQCTTLKDPDDKPWCSTKVDGNGNHVPSGGFWGHCGQDCDENQSAVQKAELAFGEGKLYLHLHLVFNSFLEWGSRQSRPIKTEIDISSEVENNFF